MASYRAIFDLHPWFTQSRWALGRGRITRGGAMRLIVTTIVAATAPHLAGVSLAQLASLCVRLAAEWPVAAIVVMLLAFGTSTTRALLALRRTLRQGWLAGLPIAEVRITFALVLVALARVIAVMLLWCGVVAIAMLDPAQPPAMAASFVPIAAGAATAALSALAQARRAPFVPRLPARAGRRDALFAVRLLDDPRLPHVADWQRRTALLRWRLGQGGHFWLLGGMLFLLPDRVGVSRAIGLALMIGAWLWLNVALRASAKTASEAFDLTRATPVRTGDAIGACLRYPLFACVCALVVATTGNVILGFSLPRLLAWSATAVVASLPSACRVVRMARQLP